MISAATVRNCMRTAIAAFALTVIAGSFSAPAAQANSGPYLPDPPSGHPSKLLSEHREPECFWFWDCRYCGSNWSFCDWDWWCHVRLYKLEV